MKFLLENPITTYKLRLSKVRFPTKVFQSRDIQPITFGKASSQLYLLYVIDIILISWLGHPIIKINGDVTLAWTYGTQKKVEGGGEFEFGTQKEVELKIQMQKIIQTIIDRTK